MHVLHDRTATNTCKCPIQGSTTGRTGEISKPRGRPMEQQSSESTVRYIIPAVRAFDGVLPGPSLAGSRRSIDGVAAIGKPGKYIQCMAPRMTP